MQRFRLKEIGLFTGLLLLSMLLLQLVWKVATAWHSDKVVPAEKINLALRRTAHYLLLESGDSSSRIPPIDRDLSKNVWLVRLEHNFNYDRLPGLLQESFAVHGVQCAYDVAVLNCASSELELGFNSIDYAENNGAPCGGRDMAADCYNLQFTLLPGQPDKRFPVAGWFFSGALAMLAFGIGRNWLYPAKNRQAPESTESQWLEFGHSRLDVPNQTLQCGAVRHQLTYRETKLLHLFASRPNQLVERSIILEKVWADEGIIVGRSVDMFVSRLRKMLRDDPSLRLSAVHGVGYRLEVES